jgi:hypothetical protein
MFCKALTLYDPKKSWVLNTQGVLAEARACSMSFHKFLVVPYFVPNSPRSKLFIVKKLILSVAYFSPSTSKKQVLAG